MAPPPRFRTLTREMLPGAPKYVDGLVRWLNEVVPGLVDALDKRLTLSENLQAQEVVGLDFTPTSPLTSFRLRVANKLVGPPKHCLVTQLAAAADGAFPATAWSMCWALTQRNELEIAFQGLTVGTKYRVSLIYL